MKTETRSDRDILEFIKKNIPLLDIAKVVESIYDGTAAYSFHTFFSQISHHSICMRNLLFISFYLLDKLWDGVVDI